MKNNPTRSIDEIANEVLAPHAMTGKQLQAVANSFQETTWLRAKVAAVAIKEGWGNSAIGRYFNVTPWTARHWKAAK